MSKAPTLQPGQFYGTVDQRWRTGLVTLSLLNHAVVRSPRTVPVLGSMLG